MLHQFQYVKINDRYFCLQQNTAVLAWILFLKKDTLTPINRSYSQKLPHKIMFWLRNKYRKFKTNLITFIVLIRYKFRFRKTESMLTLPIYGQICKPTHQGHKIFDFCRGVVIKIFDSEVSTNSVLSEIDRVRKVSKIDFAPSFKKCNVEEQWYEEDYISGSLDSSHRPMDSKILLKKFCKDIVQCIDNLMFYQPPLTKVVSEHINEIMAVLEISRLFKKGLETKEVNEVKNFVCSVIKRLNVEGSCPVYLVFTHGDFCPANMLNTKNGIKIIDWEGATYRSALFDFYSYFFYRPVCRKVPVNEMAIEINKAFAFLTSRLTLKSTDIYKSLLNSENVYRLLYYIERLSMLVEREVTDTHLNIMDCITRHIEAFNRYEEILAGNMVHLRS